MFIECLEIRWKTAQFCILNFSLYNHFVWEVISSSRHSVSSPNETPQTARRIFSFPLRMKHCIYYVKTQPTSIDFRLHPSRKSNGKTPSFTSVTRNNHPPNVYRVPEFSSPLSNACQSSVHQQGIWDHNNWQKRHV